MSTLQQKRQEYDAEIAKLQDKIRKGLLTQDKYDQEQKALVERIYGPQQ